MKQFYVTLPSTASSEIFPENNQGEFRVVLPETLKLDEKWKVGLVEAHLPAVFSNITSQTNEIHVHVKGEPKPTTLRTDFVVHAATLADLQKQFNDELPDYLMDGVNLRIKSSNDDYFAELIVKQGHHVSVPTALAKVLNWQISPIETIVLTTVSNQAFQKAKVEEFLASTPLRFVILSPAQREFPKHVVTLRSGHYGDFKALATALEAAISHASEETAALSKERDVVKITQHPDQRVEISCDPLISIEFPAEKPHLGYMLGFDPSQIGGPLSGVAVGTYPLEITAGITGLYVYSSVVEPQIVGDVYAPLLRVIPIATAKDGLITKYYDNPHMMALSSSVINTIEVKIASEQGNTIEFIGGKSLIKLVFIKDD